MPTTSLSWILRTMRESRLSGVAHQGLYFDCQEMCVSAVESELEMLNVNKATRWDGISPKILKLMTKGIAPSLTRLFNNIIRKGQWPNTWKSSEWTPVFKNGKRTDRANYRPITVLNSIDKVFESSLCKQVTEIMELHLYHTLTTYRKTHSRETTLMRLTEDYKMATYKKEYVTALSTDMSQAFDALHHALLIKTLKAYGFKDTSLKLLRSFFDPRRNRVKLQDAHREWKEQPSGCSQCSSFGPLLWNLFQNNLSLSTQSNYLFMYADDHHLYTTGTNLEDAALKLKSEAAEMWQWYSANLLKANPNKYQDWFLPSIQNQPTIILPTD